LGRDVSAAANVVFGVMTTTMLHPVMLSALEAERRRSFPRSGQLAGMLALVLGVFVLRLRQPDLPRPYRTFLYPLTPLVYLALTGWTLTFVLLNKPVEGLFGLAVIGSGLVFYFVSERASRASAPAGET